MKEKGVFLNRDGKQIGSVKSVLVGGRWVRAYCTYREQQHFYRKIGGFAIDSGILKKLIEDGINLVCVHYNGVRGVRDFLVSVDDWYLKGRPIHYSKEFGNRIETYGRQLALSKSMMKEIIVQGIGG